MLVDTTEVTIHNTKVVFFGTVHSIDNTRKLRTQLRKYDIDVILYEEHITDGFAPESVPEHRAINRVKNQDLSVRSMDVSANSSLIDELRDVYPSHPPHIRVEYLESKTSIKAYLDAFAEIYPFVFAITVLLRNYCMMREIQKEITESTHNCIGVVVGVAHIFGRYGLIQLLTE
jgi:hypothetical protein